MIIRQGHRDVGKLIMDTYTEDFCSADDECEDPAEMEYALCLLTRVYYNQQMKTFAQQPQPSLADIRAIAESGYAEAQFHLGFVYAGGQGVPRDYVEAAKWLSKAAAQGDAEAQAGLGTFYANGLGVPKDEALAYQWLLLAGAQGNAFAKKIYTRLEKTLTPEMRTEGQRLAREFKPKIAVAA